MIRLTYHFFNTKSDTSLISVCVIASTVFITVSLFTLALVTVRLFGGYQVHQSDLTINSVCEVLYVAEPQIVPATNFKPERKNYPTLIKLPNDDLRFFSLDTAMPVGFIKVLPDHKLQQFTTTH
ncbi:hypothetical protein GW933_02460 [Candidatus Falkowbacteria bacterium]|nr:hypothetical protein [Candidatus Falkowbacteria bacterium]